MTPQTPAISVPDGGSSLHEEAAAPVIRDDTVSGMVARHLLEKISRQKLRPGDSVDSEVQIGRELQVSRGSVREAYRILAALGVLEIGNGRRPRVLAMSSSALAQIFGHALLTAHATPLHVLELRRGIEVHGAQLAARLATEEQLTHLRTLAAHMRLAVHDDAQRIACDLAIHTTLAEASGNPLHTLVLAALNTAITQSLSDDYAARRTEAELIRIIDAHETIVDRVCARDPVGAGAAMACHFDLSINSMFRGRNLQTLT